MSGRIFGNPAGVDPVTWPNRWDIRKGVAVPRRPASARLRGSPRQTILHRHWPVSDGTPVICCFAAGPFHALGAL